MEGTPQDLERLEVKEIGSKGTRKFEEPKG